VRNEPSSLEAQRAWRLIRSFGRPAVDAGAASAARPAMTSDAQ